MESLLMLFDLVIPFLGLYPKEINWNVEKKLLTNMLIAGSLINEKFEKLQNSTQGGMCLWSFEDMVS